MRTEQSSSRAGAVLIGACLLCAGCREPPRRPAVEVAPPPPEVILNREPLQPLPNSPAGDPSRIALGRRLFNETRLSADDKVSCASCHDLKSGGEDGRARSVGVHGRIGAINALSVYNATFNFALSWDGRAKSLEDQMEGPLTRRTEMGSTMADALSKLGRDQDYVASFKSVFGDGITASNLRSAIAEFERSLVTRGAPFDRWLEGDDSALSPAEKDGYELFKAVGCIACHQGRNVGGNMFQKFGVLGDYFKDRGNVTQADYGRFNVTGNEADRFVFRVPSLRNVEHTAPYFHDGSAPTLPAAVQVMAKYQLGRALSGAQVDSIVGFLKTLSGQIPASAGTH